VAEPLAYLDEFRNFKPDEAENIQYQPERPARRSAQPDQTEQGGRIL